MKYSKKISRTPTVKAKTITLSRKQTARKKAVLLLITKRSDGALFLCPKGGADMVSTLILLYALNTSGTIPEGCFIAAWVLASVELVIRILAGLAKMNDKK